MIVEVRVPELGESMRSARLTAWLKREGERVTAGEPLAELETDKTNVEIEAPASGILLQIRVTAGAEALEMGAVLGTIAESASDELTEHSDPVTAVQRAASDLPASVSAPVVAALHEVDPRQPRAASEHDPAAAEATDDTTRPSATPLARRMAVVAGLDLRHIPGTGPGGRVGKVDVERALYKRRGFPEETASAPERSRTSGSSIEPAGTAIVETRALSAARRVTAARMTAAKQTIPHFYLEVTCDVDPLLALRKQLNAESDVRLSVTDFMVRAAALALAKVPLANSQWAETAIHVHKAINIAVAVNTEHGLLAPVITDAGSKGLYAIARELRALSERARAGRISPAEYSGGTFTISNLGMFGVTRLYPILNAPQSCILGIGAAEQRPVVRQNVVAPGMLMSCTLAGDHRAIDGATGAQLLAAFRALVERPLRLLV